MQYGRFSGGFRYFPVRNRRLNAAAKMKVLTHVALNSLSFDFDWPELRLAFLRWLDPEDLDGNGRQRLCVGCSWRRHRGLADV